MAIAPLPDSPLRTALDTLIVPQGAEYQAVLRGLSRISGNRTQDLAQGLGPGPGQGLPQNLTLLTIAIGPKATALRLQQALQMGWSPQRVLVLGLAGGLGSPHRVGDRVVYGEGLAMAQECVSNRWHYDEALRSLIYQRMPQAISVTALSSDRLVTTPAEKAQLAQQTGATVVDMEGSTIFKLLGKQGVAIATVRVISDDAQGSLPDLTGAVTTAGDLRPLPMALAFVRQPRAALNLVRGSLRSLGVLEQTVVDLLG